MLYPLSYGRVLRTACTGYPTPDTPQNRPGDTPEGT